MIEEGLKLYVGLAEELIEAAVPYGVPYRVDRKAIMKASLGRAIRMFEKVNRNENLIDRLDKLPEHRNYIAHVAFRRAFDKSLDVEYAIKHATEVGNEAEELLFLIQQEAKSLMMNFPNSKLANAETSWRGGNV